MSRELVAGPPPHVWGAAGVSAVMDQVLWALLPAVLAAAFWYGAAALQVLAVGTGAAWGAEAVWQRLTGRRIRIFDHSALVTGLLLALTLPPGVPLWLPLVGSAFAVVVVKGAFGGLGSNIFNPALAARAFLLASWPVPLTTWYAPLNGLASATPLARAFPREHLVSGPLPSNWSLLLGGQPGSLGEAAALAVLAGGVYLMIRRIIDWRIPVSFLGVLALAGWWGDIRGGAVFEVLAGGAPLGAFFMATDYTTAPVTVGGRWLAGLGCGLLTFFIRRFGGYPEGVTYAVLLMNAFSPWLDRLFPTRRS